jgi:hypothetical protein
MMLAGMLKDDDGNRTDQLARVLKTGGRSAKGSADRSAKGSSGRSAKGSSGGSAKG